MALQDILDTIGAEADQQIVSARSAHQKQLSQIREESEQALARSRQEIAAQKEHKIEQMRRKARGHADTLKRNSLLRAKREMLDDVFATVVQELGGLPDDKTETILRACLKQITDAGELRPAANHAALLQRLAPSEQFTMGAPIDAAGGFLFLSKKREQDFRFETLVHSSLRPKHELDVAHSLFGSAA